MDTRRLYSFVKIVDIGSLTRAATILHIAQPALSQQVAALETHFGKQLLVRSKRGVVPTDAGRMLYKHAQSILRQIEQIQTDIKTSGERVAGNVSVGLAPFSTASMLALPLLKAVRERYPGIVLHINDNFGGVLSEMVMTGRMDLAFIYDPGPLNGLDFEPLLTEDLFLVAPAALMEHLPTSDMVAFEELAAMDLMLPTKINTVRKLVDTTFRRVGATPRIVAEIESVATMTGAIQAGIGATVLPWSAASAVNAADPEILIRRITKPSIPVKVSLCTSSQLPLSEPAIAVSDILVTLARSLAGHNEKSGTKTAENRKRK